MILGIGSDLTDIRRIEKSIERFGARFLNRVFTLAEQAHGQRSGRKYEGAEAAFLAKRFAAKEAGAKALGTGFAEGIFLRDIEVLSLPSGQPILHMHRGALARLQEMLPPGHRALIHLTMTDEYPLAQAMVVLEARLA